jgi:alkanesulfonate monooxygenase SsuD/methylene tetrahydromethanopterin reductase-like flavin-dependent oxidoreductase (luciferase family)
MHHPNPVAEQWATQDIISGGRVDFAAGRGYDEREYIPFGADFKNNQSIFEEGMEIVRRLWDAHGTPISHKGEHYQFEDLAITPSPLQKELSAYVASFSKPSIELAGRLGCGLIVAPFAAAMTFGGLQQVHDLYQDSCARHGKQAKRLMCSYFIHFADNAAQEAAAFAGADHGHLHVGEDRGVARHGIGQAIAVRIGVHACDDASSVVRCGLSCGSAMRQIRCGRG